MQVTKLTGDNYKVYQVWKGMMARCKGSITSPEELHSLEVEDPPM